MHTGTLGGELRGRGLNTTPRVPALASRLGHASRGARCPHLRAVSDWHSFDQTEYRRYPRGFLAGLEHASQVPGSWLSAGADEAGPCGALSRSLLVLCKRAGFDARKAVLYDDDGRPQHTVVEVKLDDEWRVLDPTCPGTAVDA
jgi:transglutaminase-like putative cysteine protease